MDKSEAFPIWNCFQKKITKSHVTMAAQAIYKNDTNQTQFVNV